MSEWYDNQKQSISNIRQLLQEHINNFNPRRNLTAEEAKRLAKLEAIAEKLRSGENVQNRQIQMWLSGGEYAQIEVEWQEQLELRNELDLGPKKWSTAGVMIWLRLTFKGGRYEPEDIQTRTDYRHAARS